MNELHDELRGAVADLPVLTALTLSGQQRVTAAGVLRHSAGRLPQTVEEAARVIDDLQRWYGRFNQLVCLNYQEARFPGTPDSAWRYDVVELPKDHVRGLLWKCSQELRQEVLPPGEATLLSIPVTDSSDQEAFRVWIGRTTCAATLSASYQGPNTPPRPDWAALSGPRSSVLTELQADLENQLADGVAIPAAVGADREGKIVFKTVVRLDTGGEPISDAEMARGIRGLFPAESAVEAYGFVRIDLEQPEVIIVGSRGALVLQTTRAADGSIDWQLGSEGPLADVPRGGGEGSAAAVFLGGARSSADLQAIASDAIEQLRALVEGDRVGSVDEVPETMMLDLGEVWAHREVPAAGGKPSLAERVQQLRDVAHDEERTQITATRFLHDGALYIFGYHAAPDDELGFLVRVRIESPGVLSEPEALDLRELLGIE